MSNNVNYELHTYLGGVWKIDSIYDDLQIAIYEAQRLHAGGRFSAIRVVQEKFDENAGRMISKTVFRAAKADESNADTMERQKTVRREVREARKAAGLRQFKNGRGSVAANNSSPIALTLTLGGLLLAGIGVILALRYLFGAI